MTAGGGTRPPNFVFILADDMGWADLGCYGSTYHESPIIDGLAAEGMRFTDAYAACPVCSPTRASILTGKYPARLGLTDFIPGHRRGWARLIVPQNLRALPPNEVTLPERLRGAGYVSAFFGKWHLGWHKGRGTGDLFDVTGPVGPNQNDKSVTAYTDASLAFIEENKSRPFFLYLCHKTVHIPLEAPKELVEKYSARLEPGQKFPQQANPVYAAMVEHLDNSVGRILHKLDHLGLSGNTVVIFYSDNGGLIKRYDGKGEIVTSNAPLRSEKGSLYEGGVRVPLIVRWPGIVAPGSVCAAPVSSVDICPTMLDLAGVADPPDAAIDGVSLARLLMGGPEPDREAIFWHYPHYHHCTPCGAVRKGNLKLIEHFEDGSLELYDLAADIGEQSNLVGDRPDLASELAEWLRLWRRMVGAAMPEPNPAYDPERAGIWGGPS
jgi:uncharacterized sulfatase